MQTQKGDLQDRLGPDFASSWQSMVKGRPLSRAVINRGSVGVVWLALLALGFFIALTGSATAQIGGSGSINGIVTDPSGAVIPGATVAAINAATNVAITQKTSSAGTYVLSPLTAGTYTITVTAQGFKTFTQQHITVDALQQVTIKAKLSLGSK